MSSITTAQKLIKGIMKYKNTIGKDLAKVFEDVKSNPNPKTILFTCFDSRVVASRVTQADPGVFYILRNPANIIPRLEQTVKSTPIAESAALELAFIYNKCHSAAVCGHSDCKTLNILFEMRNKDLHEVKDNQSPHLKDWLVKYGKDSLTKYKQLEKKNFNGALKFKTMNGEEFDAFIDPDNKFDIQDKFSQINVLEQLKNFSTYHCLNEKIKAGYLQSHALWFDVYTGDLYMFSFRDKCFVKVNQETVEHLSEECAIKKSNN